MSRFRILSIDGGGIKGVFPAAFLAHIEGTLGGAPVSSFFDLIAGTSTGGIIALALGLGLRAGEVLEFYERHGAAIFPRKSPWWLLGPAKYETAPLRCALEKTLGSKRLGDSNRRLIIPSFNATTGRIHIFKTAHHPRLQMDFKVPAVEVALATSAAPVFFPPHRSGQEVMFIDGGIWANNPMGLAVTEAISMLGRSGDELDVLSIAAPASRPISRNAVVAGGFGRLRLLRQPWKASHLRLLEQHSTLRATATFSDSIPLCYQGASL
jgi:uncharacterized protein